VIPTSAARRKRCWAPACSAGSAPSPAPPFRLLDDEWDGPRGRIYLIKQLFEGIEPSVDSLPPAYTLKTLEGKSLAANLQLHLDRCLTCRACETSCPQGVRYGRLLDIGRELVEKISPRPLKQQLARRALRAVVPHPMRFTALLRAGQALRRFLPQDLRARIPQRRSSRPLACPRPRAPHGGLAGLRAAVAGAGHQRRRGPRAGPFRHPAAGRARRLLRRAEPSHGRHRRGARFHAQKHRPLWPHIEAGAEAIVVTASGCGAHFRDYGQLLHDDPRYRDKAQRVSDMTRDIAEVVAAEWQDGRLPECPRRSPHDASRSSRRAACSTAKN
jgi:glycolate oxidase iron-sulfur subunit